MAFSSNFFLFGFFPVVMAIYALAPLALRNTVLLIASLVFYAFDAGWLIWLLVASIILNHVVARALPQLDGGKRGTLFVAGIVLNLAALLHFKYAGFLWGVAASMLAPAGISIGAAPQIELPIGISFFTFQALSYLADVYTGRIAPARRLIDFGMYHALFPQLIAGPIVRYVEIADAVRKRETTLGPISEGVSRFCIGLGKKLIIADTLGAVADPIFALPRNELTFALAWLGLACYTLQIYYDFSGYSDMAIGLGRMLGFNFPENFNQPYRSRSITEFWRRWHMTLSRWFRDYVYIPLGGNREGPWLTYRNLLIVFVLCGLWHGAAATFLLWGIYHGALLIAERLYRERFGERSGGPLAWATTLLLIMIGWVFFRCPTLPDAFHFIGVLSGLVQNEAAVWKQSFLNGERVVVLAIGLVFALVRFEDYSWRLDGSRVSAAFKSGAALIVFTYAIMLLSFRSFNPFIYFRF